jgi:hypothetical protein
MDVIASPILTFSALSLIIILLGTSLYMLRARMVLLENKIIELDEVLQSGLTQVQELIVSSFVKSEELGQSSVEILLKGISEKIEVSQKDVSNNVKKSQNDTESSISILLQVNEQKVTGLVSSLSDSVETVTENVKNNAIYTKGIVERTGQKVLGDISDSRKVLVEQINNVIKRVSAVEDKGLSELKAAKTDLVGKIDNSTLKQTYEIINCLNKAMDNTKELIEDSTDTLSDKFELVRVSNVLTENRNIYDQGRLVLETESFVKTFDSCQLTQIEDKETGQVTKNEYQNGKISTSKTYRTDSLEYIGHYEDGILKKMEDRTGPEGSDVTKYEYDEAGEVESVI